MGNTFTVTRLLRVLPSIAYAVDAKDLLRKRLVALGTNYFGGGSPQAAARRLWEQVFEARVQPFSRDEPDFVLNAEQLEDCRFLLEHAAVRSKSELLALAVGEA
jgi:hypothetical protein